MAEAAKARTAENAARARKAQDKRSGKAPGNRHGGRRSRTSRLVLAVVIGVPLALILLPTTLVLAAGMLPTLVAYIVDRDPEKIAPVTVGALNLCGVAPYLFDLWEGIHSVAEATTLLGDPLTWFAMYGAAAVGWAFYFGIPPAVATFVAFRNQGRISHLERRQKILVEEWGNEVAGEQPVRE